MSMKEVLKNEVAKITPSSEDIKSISNRVKEFTSLLDKELSKARLDADIFVGGSFAKGTLVKQDKYDVDIFIRFSWKYSEISNLLAIPLERVCKKMGLKMDRIHGSRDYYRAHWLAGGLEFEIIPVTRIDKTKEERNVTDLSYFHVSYVKRKAKGLEDQIRLAKAFCNAQETYGAESYIHGFSGYGLECLIIYYKTFEKMLKELVKVKADRLVIDIGKAYKTKQEVLFGLNEAKLQSPVVLVDPTHKERNVLAALNRETFEVFQKAAKAFLAKPSKEYFERKRIDIEQLKKIAKTNQAEYVVVAATTDRQSGDIAGTKLKKFSLYLEKELARNCEIVKTKFEYHDTQEATIHIIARPRKEIVRVGPPVKMKDYVRDFKKAHKSTFVRNGLVHARIVLNENLKERVFAIVSDKEKINSMGVDSVACDKVV